jgi:isopenicillin-N N-acyltransferase-like protein
MTFPIVHLTGTPYEQGLQHGRELRDRIAHNLDVYFDRFAREVKVQRPEVLELAHKHAANIRRHNPDYYASLEGLAEGSGFGLDELTALNVRYEILYYQFGVLATAAEAALGHPHRPEPDGCTAFAVLPQASASGHLLVGQNWDWIPEVQGAVLHTVEPDGLQTLAFTEAGIVGGKIGLNSAGVALAINGMTTTDDDWSRMSKPFHVRCYEILRSRSFAAAVDVVTGAERACSTNFLIAQTPDQVVDVEAAPDDVMLLQCENSCLVHTNHFVDPGSIGVVEPPSERRPYSQMRRARMTELLAQRRPVELAALEEHLRDHQEYPFGICRHRDLTLPPEEHYITVTAVVMDVAAGEMFLSDGPPCESPYQRVALQ